MRATITSLALVALMIPAATGLAVPCGDGVTQEAWLVDGGWQLSQGPLATVEPVAGGLSWQTLEGVSLDIVMAETAPTETDGAVVSSAWAVPGAASGTIEVVGDGDFRVSFSGSVPCSVEIHATVHEDPAEAFVPPAPQPVAHTAVTAQPSPTITETVAAYPRRHDRSVFFPE
jgi:hypothetical protein